MTGLQLVVDPALAPYVAMALELLVRRMRREGIRVPEDLVELQRWAGAAQAGLSAPPAVDVGDDSPVPLLLRLPEAAQRLGCSLSTVKRLVASGQLATVELAGRRRIPVAELETFVRRLRGVPMRESIVTKASPAPPRRPARPEPAEADGHEGGAVSGGRRR